MHSPFASIISSRDHEDKGRGRRRFYRARQALVALCATSLAALTLTVVGALGLPALPAAATGTPIAPGTVGTLPLSSEAPTASDGFTYVDFPIVSGYAYVPTPCAIYKISTSTGDTTDFAGSNSDCGYTNGDSGDDSTFDTIVGLATDGSNLFVLERYGTDDADTSIREVSLSSGATTSLWSKDVATRSQTEAPQGLITYGDGDLYVALGQDVYQVDTSSGDSSLWADLSSYDPVYVLGGSYCDGAINSLSIDDGTIYAALCDNYIVTMTEGPTPAPSTDPAILNGGSIDVSEISLNGYMYMWGQNESAEGGPIDRREKADSGSRSPL
jgi:hypothetical protein